MILLMMYLMLTMMMITRMMIKMMLMYHMALMMMMTMSMSTMMMHVIILMYTVGLEILELITSNRGCEVLTIKILLAIVRLWVLHCLIWTLGLVVPPTPPTSPLHNGSTIPLIMVLPKCHPTRLFWTAPHPYPHFYQEHPRHKKWISILTQKLTLFVLLRKFWSWFKTE